MTDRGIGRGKKRKNPRMGIRGFVGDMKVRRYQKREKSWKS